MNLSVLNKMKNGESVFGTWCMLPSSSVVDVIARTGVDFVVLDLEHGALSWETTEDMVRSAQLHQCQAIIRVGDDHENTILHALETGCEAIMVPHVSSVAAAERIVEAARYSPKGKRGLSPYTRCHGYTHHNLGNSMEYHANETMVGVLVEGKEGIENLSEISAVEGIDLIYLGMYDISQSVGLAGQLEHPEVQKQLDICLNRILKQNKFAGTFSRDIQSSIEFKKKGFQFVAYIADSYALSSYYTDAVAEWKTD